MKMTLKESLGFTVLSLLVSCLLLCLQTGCAKHSATSENLRRLQGSWEGVLVGTEGKISMKITGNSLHYHGLNTNEVYGATFTLPAETTPHELRATITSAVHTNSIGAVVRAFFEIGNGKLTLVLNQDAGQEPPKSLGDDTPGLTRYEFRKVQPQKKSVEASTSNEAGQASR